MLARGIDAAWVDGDPYPQIVDGRELRGGSVQPVIDPSTNEKVAEWTEATEEEIDLAVAVSRRRFEEAVWSRAPYAHRAEVLEAAAQAIT
ncbi:MAG TPA: aldehyde dehydrogenase family protein, partial [Acidimicrobiales bacterium]|nr:aldehyde dehydrogenase family protein [Acidimicrobiales bacterium]